MGGDDIPVRPSHGHFVSESILEISQHPLVSIRLSAPAQHSVFLRMTSSSVDWTYMLAHGSQTSNIGCACCKQRLCGLIVHQ